MIRVALIHEIVSPYREPIFAALASQDDLDVTVVLSAERESRHCWDVDLHNLPYRWMMVPSRALVLGRTEKWTWYVPLDMQGTLDRLQPDVVVINGYANLPALAALRWARRRGAPVVMWSESIRSGRGGQVRRMKRAVVGQADAYIVPGELAARHLGALGADRRKLFTAPNCIDLELFRPTPDKARQPVILACGQLIARKGCALLGPSLDQADPDRQARLLIVGKGPERDRVEATLAALRVPATFTGHVQYHELPTLFATADAVLFPSLDDVWGFSLQEAMACGLPAVASYKAGATWELVEDGVSGWIVAPEVASIAIALKKLLAMRSDEWSAMGAAARASAERLSVTAAVEGFRAAIVAARGPTGP